MTAVEMTEAEIMKALECLASQGEYTVQNALDLINRKNAEIEVYKERFEMLDSNSQMAIGYADALEERARAEAIKEFADRLKEAGAKSVEVAFYGNGTETIEFITLRTNLVDQIAKEMGVEL